MSASNAFTCAACGATFEKAWTDEEANAEADELWGDDLGDEPATVLRGLLPGHDRRETDS